MENNKKDIFNITPGEFAKMSEGKISEPPKVPTPYVDAMACKETLPQENAVDLKQMQEMIADLSSSLYSEEE